MNSINILKCIELLEHGNDYQTQLKHKLILIKDEQKLSWASLFVQLMNELILNYGIDKVVTSLEQTNFQVGTNAFQIDLSKENIEYNEIYPKREKKVKKFPIIIKLLNNTKNFKDLNIAPKKSLNDYQLVQNKYVISNQISLGETKHNSDWECLLNFLEHLKIYEKNDDVIIDLNKLRQYNVYDSDQNIKKLINENTLSYRRNEKIIEQYKNMFMKSFRCNRCNEEYVWKIEGNDKIYNFNIHHLIPLNYEKSFENKRLKLDVICNLIDVCPKCHSEIHFFNEELKFAKVILNKREPQKNITLKQYFIDKEK